MLSDLFVVAAVLFFLLFFLFLPELYFEGFCNFQIACTGIKIQSIILSFFFKQFI